MLAYICKYVPIEIFESMGVSMMSLKPQVSNFQQADIKLHPNLCSFVKGVLEVMLTEDYDGIILTTCCDSVRRLYDVLKKALPEKFIYMLDIPRNDGPSAITLYQKRIQAMMAEWEIYSNQKFSLERLYATLSKSIPLNDKGKSITKGPRIGVIGARANPAIADILKTHHVNLAFDLTCTGVERRFSIDIKDDNLLTTYIRKLLGQFPCLRMQNASARDEIIEDSIAEVDGIIYHTVQFCDSYAYEYAWLKQHINVPILLLDTDNTAQSRGQILTRIEAFLESIGSTPQEGCIETTASKEYFVMGIDSGSTSTNAVIMDTNREIRSFSVVRTGAKASESAQKVLQDVLDKAQIKRENLKYVVATGYGRVSIDFADENVTEISCHGRGAHYFNPQIRTILDIGGQDSKAIRLDEQGEVIDFVMNDKCAAGTGRFLEMIARTLEIGVDSLGQMALQAKETIEITSMCSVFAESEVISLIAQNKETPDIAWSVCRSIAGRACGLLRRVSGESTFMMTGGVAKNPGVIKAVEEQIGEQLYVCQEPEIVGAVGAALYALDHIRQ